MLFASRAYLAAFNALLAEHDLGFIELVPENSFAAKLKDGMISAFGVGTRIRFDEDWWVKTFNAADRAVQLNFVGMGLNELGMRPLLPGEAWQQVRNPLLIGSIDTKLDKAARVIARRHGEIVHLRNSRLALREWGLEDSPEHSISDSAMERSPSLQFMNELPHPDHYWPTDVLRSGPLSFMYYENPKTIGEVTIGGSHFYKYPQIVVVVNEHKQPLLIVRIEESAFGTTMLCTVMPDGSRSNLGLFSRTDRRSFIKKVSEIVSNANQR